MVTNFNRLSKELDALLDCGATLRLSLRRAENREKIDAQLNRVLGKEEADRIRGILPDFRRDYDTWYSEALAVIKDLLPDRLADFKSLYQRPANRRAVDHENYVIRDYLQGLSIRLGSDVMVDGSAAIPQFDQQLSILKAARARLKSSLFELRKVVQAEVFDSEIGSARELLEKKFLRAAGAVAGVILEKCLRQICNDHGIKVSKKAPSLSDLSELLKTHGVIELPQWRHLCLLADIRNVCVHSKKLDPTAEQVADLIDGTERVLKAFA